MCMFKVCGFVQVTKVDGLQAQLKLKITYLSDHSCYYSSLCKVRVLPNHVLVVFLQTTNGINVI